MPRTVLVNSNHIVEQIIMTGADYTAPTGLIAVDSNSASVGDVYNPSTGAFTTPSSAPTQPQLIEYAYHLSTIIAKNGVSVNVNPLGQTPLMVSADTDAVGRADLAGAVMRAQLDANYSTTWATNTGPIYLNATQVITLGNSVAAWIESIYAVSGQIVSRVMTGNITTMDQVLHPTSPIPSWPVNS